MWKYVLKRILLAFITAFIILSLTFILCNLLPITKAIGTDKEQFAYYMKQVNLGFAKYFNTEHTDYGKLLFSYTLTGDNGSTHYYFYKMPVMTKYFAWLKNIFTAWDWGVSTTMSPGIDVSQIIAEKLPATIKVNIFSVIISVPLGILLGIVAALNKNKPVDHVISTLVMIFISIPSFVLISIFMLWLCYHGPLPEQWAAKSEAWSQRALSLILPVLCSSFGSICGYCRFTRAELCEVMSSEYLLLARTKGLTKRQAILRHALRNAMVPIVPSIIAEVIGLLGGSMILENLYGIPGIGKLFINAINYKDWNVLFVDMAIFTTIGLLSGVLLDISYGFIDPRIRMGAKK